jgi:hypothetical protein
MGSSGGATKVLHIQSASAPSTRRGHQAEEAVYDRVSRLDSKTSADQTAFVRDLDDLGTILPQPV